MDTDKNNAKMLVLIWHGLLIILSVGYAKHLEVRIKTKYRAFLCVYNNKIQGTKEFSKSR